MKNLIVLCVFALMEVSFAAPAPLANALVMSSVESKPRGLLTKTTEEAEKDLGEVILLGR
ncbi:hypothetical protein MMC22_001846 [Lobaria immixta]|nr:hypothetical protein [Lobaria immixta]